MPPSIVTRVRFGHHEPLARTDLLALHTSAYAEFLQLNAPAKARKPTGLHAAFERAFPIESADGALRFEYMDYQIDAPRYDEGDCRVRGMTYAATLRVLIRYLVHKRDENGEELMLVDIKEQEVYFGQIPLMTERGTFIVDGVERILAPQLVRAPGVYFERNRGRIIASIVPLRGPALLFEMDASAARIDRRHEVPAMMLCRALGVSPEQLAARPWLEAVVATRPGPLESLAKRSASFEAPLYDLGEIGRANLNRKLNQGEPLCTRVLTPRDLVAVLDRLFDLRQGRAPLDAAGDLRDLTVRTVGDLVGAQVGVGLDRMRSAITERFRTVTDASELMPHDFVNAMPLAMAMRELFGSAFASPRVDTTNPLAETAQKRRLFTAELADFEAHETQYGRLCPVDIGHTGRNVSLSLDARIVAGGAIDTPHRPSDGAEASPPIFSLAASLIPFLAHDEPHRAAVACEVQRQALPPLRAAPPLVATGMEAAVARHCGTTVVARRSGTVMRVDAERIAVVPDESDAPDIYPLAKMRPWFQPRLLAQRPNVRVGERVERGTVLADGVGTDGGELALGQNVRVAFMPWHGLNFREAIVVSDRLVHDDVFTSVHLEMFECVVRDTRYGREEVVRDIPSARHRAMRHLDGSGIVRLGAEVGAGDVLVGMVTPRRDVELSPDELVASEKADRYEEYFADASLRVPRGISGMVVDVRTFTRKGAERSERESAIAALEGERLRRAHDARVEILSAACDDRIRGVLVGKTVAAPLVDEGEVVCAAGTVLTAERLAGIPPQQLRHVELTSPEDTSRIQTLAASLAATLEHEADELREALARLEYGDELPPGVIRMVRVYVATKRKLEVGDMLGDRHGTKGVVSRIVPAQDLPHLEDGTPVDVVVNPLLVLGRMTAGQLLEAGLGWAAHALGQTFVTSPFGGATQADVAAALENAGLPRSGQAILCDGHTGEPFERPVTVGVLYMFKLRALAHDAFAARSTGSYSHVTHQPIACEQHFGGQHFDDDAQMALAAHGAAHSLREMTTVKSDDMAGRRRLQATLDAGEAPTSQPGIPTSVKDLRRHLQALGLDLQMLEGAPEAAE